jgi:hypothetical protein
MARTKRILTASLVAAMAVLASARPVSAQDARLTLRVRNDADLPNDLIAATKTAVTAIYAKAGIDATFVDGQADYVVALLSRQTVDKMHQGGDAVGFAPGSETARGHVAYVLQPRVDKIADGYGTVRSVVLAAAMAHEVGHLLMFNAHSSAGIMRAAWNQADFRQAVRGNLLFTLEQAAQMRARLSGDRLEIAMAR